MNSALSSITGVFGVISDLGLASFTLLAEVGDLAGRVAADASQTFEFGRIEQPIDWILPVVALAAVLTFVWLVYRRDCVDLHWSLSILLAGLRTAAFVGLFWVLLDPRYRVERIVKQDSRVILLVDTSLSMGLNDNDSGSVTSGPNRSEQIINALNQGKFVENLRAAHEVVLIRFDQDKQMLYSLARIQKSTDGKLTEEDKKKIQEEVKVDWKKLEPQGRETRLGEALRDVIADHRAAPVSALVVFTDGQQNVGIEPASGIEAAIEAKVKVYTVGLGSNQQPVNARIADFIAPSRAHKGDDYTVTGYLQGRGLANQTVTVELVSNTPGAAAGAEKLEGTEQVVLGADAEPVPVRFKLEANQVGRRTLKLRLRPPPKDSNREDDAQEVDVEVVDRKSRVLLFAGGPSREYQFLRNQLFRDSEVIVDVLLQSAVQGVSQDSNQILDTFPTTAAELSEYDCIVAFDPDWRKLSPEQIDLLDAWVAEQSGGLVVLAGPVYTEDWSMGTNMEKIRALYPVEFNKKFSLLDSKRFENKQAWPIELTRDGLEAEFLWLTDDAPTSRQAWNSLEGVYGYYSVKGPKPGATVYGRYSDPQASDGDHQPVYFAGQFFGSGRVFYLGSGEMWRARQEEEKYFDRFYTKLIRHVSQGRLLRGSRRGVLLVERDRYLLGDTVSVRAQMYDHALKPLDVPSVGLEVVAPDSTLSQVTLLADKSGRKGSYVGQFAVRHEGAFRLELRIPDAADEERLTRRIQVRVPDLERENPQRNDPLLQNIADQTQAKYLRGVDHLDQIVAELPPAERMAVLTETPISLWDNQRTLLILCCLLFAEWLFRKLLKLA